MQDKIPNFQTFKTSLSRLLKRMPTDQTYNAIIQEAKDLFGAIQGSIYLEIDGVIKRVYSTIPAAERIESRRKGYTQKAFDEKIIVVVPVKDFLKIHPEYKPDGITHFVTIPLVFNNTSIALLSLQLKKEGKFTQTDFDSMQAFACVASLRIRNSILHEELEDSLKIRDMFISLALHEIKTPITTLSGYINLSKKKNSTNYFDSMNTQIGRLNDLIKSFEKFNEIRQDSKAIKIKKIDLRQTLNRAIITFRTRYPSYQILTEEEINSNGIKIRGDSYKISQVITNLLDNAAKFSKDITPLIVQLKKDEKNAILNIKDSGQGMSTLDIKRALSGHYKAGHTQQGIGLGIYLSKIIIESHGGKLTIKSKKGKGTEVKIKIPISI